MLIVVDTNALVAIVRANLEPLLELIAYARRYGGVVVLPEVVTTEFKAYLDRHLSETQNKFQAIVGRLPQSAAMSEHLSKLLAEASGAKVALTEKLRQLERRKRLVPAPIRVTHARRAVARAASRRPPCSSSGEEIRDALIWEAAVDLLKRHNGPLALISGDKAFQDETLVAEIRSLDCELLIYKSIDSFMQKIVLDQQSIPHDVLEALEDPRQLAMRLAVCVAEDPCGSWDAAISNFIEGGMLDLIAGNYRVQGVSGVVITGGVQRPIDRGRYHAYVSFKATVWLRCEAFEWRELPPGEYQPDDEELRDNDLLCKLYEVMPIRVPAGEPQVVDIDFHVQGEAAYSVISGTFESEPLHIYASPLSSGYHGGPLTSRLILFPDM